jgi:hypothetical protein
MTDACSSHYHPVVAGTVKRVGQNFPMNTMINKLLLFCLLTTGALAAGTTYSISSISESSDGKWILVDGNWRKDCPKRLEVKLRVSEDVPSDKVFVKAYFYDKDKKLIHTYSTPNIIWEGTDRGYEKIGLPPVLKKSGMTEVYFAITPELLKRFPKTTLIVFGDNSVTVVKAKNEVNPMEFEFPEKNKVSAPKK